MRRSAAISAPGETASLTPQLAAAAYSAVAGPDFTRSDTRGGRVPILAGTVNNNHRNRKTVISGANTHNQETRPAHRPQLLQEAVGIQACKVLDQYCCPRDCSGVDHRTRLVRKSAHLQWRSHVRSPLRPRKSVRDVPCAAVWWIFGQGC